MNLNLNIVIEVIVFALVVALAMAGLRTAEAMWDVRRRLGGSGREVTGSASGLIRSDATTNPFLKWVQRTTADDKD